MKKYLKFLLTLVVLITLTGPIKASIEATEEGEVNPRVRKMVLQGDWLAAPLLVKDATPEETEQYFIDQAYSAGKWGLVNGVLSLITPEYSTVLSGMMGAFNPFVNDGDGWIKKKIFLHPNQVRPYSSFLNYRSYAIRIGVPILIESFLPGSSLLGRFLIQSSGMFLGAWGDVTRGFGPKRSAQELVKVMKAGGQRLASCVRRQPQKDEKKKF
jgi:hypothetical protein